MDLSRFSHYELLSYIDPKFPIIFHHDIWCMGQTPYMLHWHDAVEILFFTSGKCHIMHNGTSFTAGETDMVVFDSNCLHTTDALSPVCEYDCLIVDSSLLSQSGLPIDTMAFSKLFQDPAAAQYYKKIKEELCKQPSFYKTAAKALVLEFFVYLSRNHAILNAEQNETLNSRLDMTKSAMAFMQANYHRPLTVDDICRHAGFSKYYFCRNFKELTGHTVIEYLNIIRCKQAKLLLTNEHVSVSQAAQLCQFNHLSYFSKTYKKYMGILPGTEKALSNI